MQASHAKRPASMLKQAMLMKGVAAVFKVRILIRRVDIKVLAGKEFRKGQTDSVEVET